MNLTHNNPPPFRTFQGSESRGEKLMNTISHLRHPGCPMATTPPKSGGGQQSKIHKNCCLVLRSFTCKSCCRII